MIPLIITFVVLIFSVFIPLCQADNPLWIFVGGPYYAEVDEPVHFYLDIQGGVLPYSHHWDFGDGNSSLDRFPTHCYANVGNYTTTATVTDGGGTTKTGYALVTIFEPLQVTITAPHECERGKPIVLHTDISGGVPAFNISWTFDDEASYSTRFGSNVQVSWETPGLYSIEVHVTDSIGTVENQVATISVVEENLAPLKPIRPNGTINGRGGKEYIYMSNAIDPNDDEIYYLWDFGDGTDVEWVGPFESGHQVSISHAWSDEGEYVVRLKAKDEQGFESEWSDALVVTMPKMRLISFFTYFQQHRFFHFSALVDFFP